MTLLARLIAKEEGFGIPGAIPTIRHNPGDLRHSPHSQHPGDPSHKDDVGTIDTDEHGWQDLERQLKMYAERVMPADLSLSKINMKYKKSHLMTLREMIYCYAPPTDGNRTEQYLKFVCSGLKLSPEASVATALTVREI